MQSLAVCDALYNNSYQDLPIRSNDDETIDEDDHNSPPVLCGYFDCDDDLVNKIRSRDFLKIANKEVLTSCCKGARK